MPLMSFLTDSMYLAALGALLMVMGAVYFGATGLFTQGGLRPPQYAYLEGFLGPSEQQPVRIQVSGALLPAPGAGQRMLVRWNLQQALQPEPLWQTLDWHWKTVYRKGNAVHLLDIADEG